jgi:hypothetical protein
MDIDPHTVQQLLEKIRTQLRCPQCTKRVDVRFDSLKVMGDNFAVFQMQCNLCSAYILLHATLAGTKPPSHARLSRSPHSGSSAAHHNASTVLELDEKELAALRNAIKGAEGKFSDLFEESL